MQSSWVEIDLDGLRANIDALRAVISPATDIIFVVKADAYGHGLPVVVSAAASCGIRWFGVAHLHEARAVRAATPVGNILLMGVADPSDAPELAALGITPMIVSAEHGQALAAEAVRAGVSLTAHLKVDTGMGRLGVYWPEAVETFGALQGRSGLKVTGVCSHFAAVEPKQPQSSEEQAERFFKVASAMEELNGAPLCKHISSSRAILYRPEWDLDAIRPGICLYGYGAGERDMRFHTRPVLQWKTTLMQVRSVPAGFPVGYYGLHVTETATRLGVLPVGYADGYHRALSNRGHVLVGGRRCPVVGRVSMNWITIDLGADSTERAGDEVVMIGEQGTESIWAGELARICRTIPYEILVGIDQRTTRLVTDASTSPRSRR
jgi:alanine racemase